MNSYERVTARLRGEPVDRPPNFNIMMQFAAEIIRQPFSAYYQDYRVLCAANFAVQEAFSLDVLQAISDPYREAADFGAQIEFPGGQHAAVQDPTAGRVARSGAVADSRSEAPASA